MNSCFEHGVQISLRDPASTSFGYLARSEIAGSVVILFLTFLGSFIVAAPFYIPSNSVQVFQYLHLFYSGFVVVVTSHSNDNEVVAHWDFFFFAFL